MVRPDFVDTSNDDHNSEDHLNEPEPIYGKVRIAAAMLPVVAEALDVGITGLIGTEPKTPKKAAPRKRGPAPKIQRQLERVSALPKPQQRFVMQVIDSVIAQPSR